MILFSALIQVYLEDIFGGWVSGRGKLYSAVKVTLSYSWKDTQGDVGLGALLAEGDDALNTSR